MRFLRGFMVIRGGGPYPNMGYLGGGRGIYASLRDDNPCCFFCAAPYHIC